MASAFNLTAQLNIVGPNNLRPVISSIRRELSTLNTNINLGISANTARDVRAVTNSLGQLNSVLTQTASISQQVSANLRNIQTSASSAQSATNNLAQGLNNVNNNANNANRNIGNAASQMELFGRQSAVAIRRFAAFAGVTGIIYGLTRAFSSAFDEFIKFDREVVKLIQVTGQSKGALSSVTDEVTRLSTNLGVSSNSLIEVTTTLAQAGLTANQTRTALEALAKASLAPSFDDLNATVEGSIALMRQFGISSAQLESALGSVNAVAAAFAVEAGDIITAIQRTGGVFASASKGVSQGTDALNEFVAVFTSVRATTRESAETIATGLRTIFTRIQRGSTINFLNELGIQLTDVEGKFIGPYKAIEQLSKGLKSLDPRDLRFSQIVEELGGFRQIGKVIPLIQQFATAQEALKVAQRGSDSLTKNSIEAQLSLSNQLTKTREQFLAFVRSLGESQTFKVLTSLSLNLANSLISIGTAFKPILPYLAILGAIKGTQAAVQFGGGFLGAFRSGGGAGAAGQNLGNTVTGGGGGGTGGGNTAANTTAVLANTNSLGTLTTAVNNLANTMVNATNALARTIQQNSGRGPLGFASGGVVPGSGNRDTVSAMLTPGEFVIRKKAVAAIGANNLHKMNKYATGGTVKDKEELPISTSTNFAHLTSRQKAPASLQKAWSDRARQGELQDVYDNTGLDLPSTWNNDWSLNPNNKIVSGKTLSNYIKNPSNKVFKTLLAVGRASKNTPYGFAGKSKSTAFGILNQYQDDIRNLFASKISDNIDYDTDYDIYQNNLANKLFDSINSVITNKSQADTLISGLREKSAVSVKKEGDLSRRSLPKTLRSQMFADGGIVRRNNDTYLEADVIRAMRELTGVELTDQQALEEFMKKNEDGHFYYSDFGHPKNSKKLPKWFGSYRPQSSGALEAIQAATMEKQDRMAELRRKKGLVSFDYEGKSSEEKNFIKSRGYNLGGFIQNFAVGGSVEEIAQAQNMSLQDAILSTLKEAGGITGIKGSLGVTSGDRTLDSILRASNIKAGKNIPEASEFINRYLKRQNRAAQEIEKANKVGIVGLQPFDYKKDVGPIDLGGTNSMVYIRGLSSKFADAVMQMRESIATTVGSFAENIQTRKLLGGTRPLRLDFDETLVSGADIYGPNGEIDIPGYSDMDRVQNALKKGVLTPLGEKLKKLIELDPSILNRISILTARPQSNANLLSEKLNSLGLPISANKIIGTSGGGKTKADAVGDIDRLIDDNLQNVVATRSQNKRALQYSPIKALTEEQKKATGFANIEGAVFEATLTALGARGGVIQNRSVDYAKGLGMAAQYFPGIGPDWPTEVKRTLDSDSISDAKSQLASFYDRSGAMQKFAVGGSVSSEDTVPALLTPGEFVINKKAAQRIGAYKLNKLNKADKIQGFNAGGAVGSLIQRFEDGGQAASNRLINQIRQFITVLEAQELSVKSPARQQTIVGLESVIASVSLGSTSLSDAAKQVENATSDLSKILIRTGNTEQGQGVKGLSDVFAEMRRAEESRKPKTQTPTTQNNTQTTAQATQASQASTATTNALTAVATSAKQTAGSLTTLNTVAPKLASQYQSISKFLGGTAGVIGTAATVIGSELPKLYATIDKYANTDIRLSSTAAGIAGGIQQGGAQALTTTTSFRQAGFGTSATAIATLGSSISGAVSGYLKAKEQKDTENLRVSLAERDKNLEQLFQRIELAPNAEQRNQLIDQAYAELGQQLNSLGTTYENTTETFSSQVSRAAESISGAILQIAAMRLAFGRGMNKGGPVYASKGMMVNYQPRGTDTIPAMLSPGEFVVNAKASRKNIGILNAINKSNGGKIKYLARGTRRLRRQIEDDSIGGSYLGSYMRNFGQFYNPYDTTQMEGNDLGGSTLRVAGRTSMAAGVAAGTAVGGAGLMTGLGAALRAIGSLPSVIAGAVSGQGVAAGTAAAGTAAAGTAARTGGGFLGKLLTGGILAQTGYSFFTGARSSDAQREREARKVEQLREPSSALNKIAAQEIKKLSTEQLIANTRRVDQADLKSRKDLESLTTGDTNTLIRSTQKAAAAAGLDPEQAAKDLVITAFKKNSALAIEEQDALVKLIQSREDEAAQLYDRMSAGEELSKEETRLAKAYETVVISGRKALVLQDQQAQLSDRNNRVLIQANNAAENFNNAMTTLSSVLTKASATFTNSVNKIDTAVGSRLTGRSEFGAVDTTNLDILSNTRAYSNEEIRRASRSTTSAYGFDNIRMDSSLGGSLGDVMENASIAMKELEINLPKVLQNMQNIQGEEGQAIPSQDISKFLVNAGIGKSVADEIAKQISDAASKSTSEGKNVSYADLAKDVPAFLKTTEMFKNINDAQVNIIKQTNDALNTYRQRLKQAADALVEAAKMGADFGRARADFRIQLKESLGRFVGVGEKNAVVDQEMSSLTTVRDESNNIIQAGTSDINEIIRRRDEAEQTKLRLEQQTANADAQTQMQVSRATKTQIQIINQSNEAIRKFASDTTKASNVLNAIGDRRQTLEARQGTFLDVLSNLDNPDALMEMTRRGQAVSNIRSGEATQRDLMIAAKNFRQDIALMDPENRQRYTQQFGGVASSFMRQQGVDENTIKTFLASLKPENDPEIQRLKFLADAIVQAQAAAQEKLVADQVAGAKTINDLLIKAAEDFSGIIAKGGQDAANSLRGIIPGQGQPAPQPAPRFSKGGAIYASGGQLINFQPKGTDTVPAMLSPGEFVINAKATAKHLPLLESINSGSYSDGGVVYLAKGGKEYKTPYAGTGLGNILQKRHDEYAAMMAARRKAAGIKDKDSEVTSIGTLERRQNYNKSMAEGRVAKKEKEAANKQNEIMAGYTAAKASNPALNMSDYAYNAGLDEDEKDILFNNVMAQQSAANKKAVEDSMLAQQKESENQLQARTTAEKAAIDAKYEQRQSEDMAQKQRDQAKTNAEMQAVEGRVQASVSQFSETQGLAAFQRQTATAQEQVRNDRAAKAAAVEQQAETQRQTQFEATVQSNRESSRLVVLTDKSKKGQKLTKEEDMELATLERSRGVPYMSQQASVASHQNLQRQQEQSLGEPDRQAYLAGRSQRFEQNLTENKKKYDASTVIGGIVTAGISGGGFNDEQILNSPITQAIGIAGNVATDPGTYLGGAGIATNLATGAGALTGTVAGLSNGDTGLLDIAMGAGSLAIGGVGLKKSVDIAESIDASRRAATRSQALARRNKILDMNNRMQKASRDQAMLRKWLEETTARNMKQEDRIAMSFLNDPDVIKDAGTIEKTNAIIRPQTAPKPVVTAPSTTTQPSLSPKPQPKKIFKSTLSAQVYKSPEELAKRVKKYPKAYPDNETTPKVYDITEDMGPITAKERKALAKTLKSSTSSGTTTLSDIMKTDVNTLASSAGKGAAKFLGKNAIFGTTTGLGAYGVSSLMGQYNEAVSDQTEAAQIGDRLDRNRPNRKPNPRTGYYSTGSMVSYGSSKDSIPAMLTPGEFVVNRSATQRHLGLLQSINSGKIQGYNKGGLVNYLQEGGQPSIGSASGGVSIDFSVFKDSVSSFEGIVSKFENSVNQIPKLDFSSLTSSLNTLSSSMSALTAPINMFNEAAKAFGSSLSNTASLIGALSKIPSTLTITGRIDMPTNLTVTLDGQTSEIGPELKSEIINAVARGLKQGNPEINVESLIDQR